MNNSNTSDTIRLDNLTIGYKTHDGIRTVAKDINASIKSGKLTCLVGTNGIGKSTLLRTLSGFQPRQRAVGLHAARPLAHSQRGAYVEAVVDKLHRRGDSGTWPHALHRILGNAQ